jgi:hypothetical protein
MTPKELVVVIVNHEVLGPTRVQPERPFPRQSQSHPPVQQDCPRLATLLDFLGTSTKKLARIGGRILQRQTKEIIDNKKRRKKKRKEKEKHKPNITRRLDSSSTAILSTISETPVFLLC